MIRYNILMEDGAVLPARANKTDTGYDLVALEEPKIVGGQLSNFDPSSDGLEVTTGIYDRWRAIDYLEYRTGIRLGGGTDNNPTESDLFKRIFSPNPLVYTLLYPRSSISKYNLILANSVGVVDAGYRNEIILRFKYIFQPEDLNTYDIGYISIEINPKKIYHKGDRIAQLVPMVLNSDVSFDMVSHLDETPRGIGGFGSSGV